jgi:hypothetical protein
MASPSDMVLITAECLCKAHKFTTEVPKSKLPLQASACHCNSCRHSTGALYSVDTTWPEPRQNVDTTGLKSYPFSSSLSVLFCGTCSTTLFWDSTKEVRDLGVFTGALQNIDVDLVKIVDHIYVGDTIDGGATMWLRKPNADGSKARRFAKRNDGEQYPHDWPPASTFTGYEKKTEESSIPIRCHCKGVDLRLHRGSYEGKTKEELPRFIDPKTYKSAAGFDVCDSCRLQSGIDIFHWTFTGLADVATPHEGGEDRFPKSVAKLKAAVDAQDAAIGTLAYYQSSPDVQRYFCKVCSAVCFYACDDYAHNDGKNDFMDVAVGVLDAQDGARAEGFLSWAFGGPMVWEGDVKGGWREEFMKRVREEAEEWRIERGYPKDWRRVEKEETKS